MQAFFESIIGKGIMGILAVVILVIAVGIGNSRKQFNVKVLVYSAVAIALATALSFVKLPVPFFVNGGSITLLSMLIVVLIGYWFGPVQGLLSAMVYGIIQLILAPYVVHPVQLIFDYFLAFGMLGLGGFFRRYKHGLIIGYLVAVSGRFVFAFLSGYIFFGSYAPEGMSPLYYSIIYNLGYLLPEALITIALLSIPSVKGAIRRVGQSALSA